MGRLGGTPIAREIAPEPVARGPYRVQMVSTQRMPAVSTADGMTRQQVGNHVRDMLDCIEQIGPIPDVEGRWTTVIVIEHVPEKKAKL